GGLDDLDLAVAPLQHSRQGHRRHPAGRSPAHDDDFAQASIARVSGRQHDRRSSGGRRAQAYREAELARDEVAMRRQRFREPADGGPSLLHQAAQARLLDVVDEGIMPLGIESLAEQNRCPARLLVRLLTVEGHAGGARPDIDLVPQRLRQLHRAAVAPEIGVLPLSHAVMRDQEIAQALVLVAGETVVFQRQRRIEAAVGKEIDEPRGGILDELDARRLERLQEAGGEPDRDAVAAPDLPAHTGNEREQPRLAKRAAAEAAEQLCSRLLFGHEATAVDVSVADAMLQRNSPLPAGRTGTGHRVRCELRGALGGDGHSAIAGQPIGPVLVTRLQRLLDDQTPEAGSIDEELTADFAAIGERQALYEPVRRTQADIRYLPFDPPHAMPFSHRAQVSRVEPSVEVIGVAIVGGR